MATSFNKKKVLEAIADSFAKIQVKDRRVTRVCMPDECFWDIATNRESLVSILNGKSILDSEAEAPLRRNHAENLGRIIDSEDTFRVESTEEHPDTIGRLWGAHIYFGKKIEVISDDYRFIPGEGVEMPQIEAMSAPIIEEVPINLKIYNLTGLTIHVKTRARPFRDMSSSEITAVETLREMITEKEYRKYIKYGFILVSDGKGNVYQIFRNGAHTSVWNNGKVIKEVCVRIKDRKIPPTDNLIAFKTIIETDPTEFEKMGNVYKMEVA